MLNILNIFRKRDINKKQRDLNERYGKEGLTDEILDEQVELNKLRSKYNIVDETEIVNDEGFVQ